MTEEPRFPPESFSFFSEPWINRAKSQGLRHILVPKAGVGGGGGSRCQRIPNHFICSVWGSSSAWWSCCFLHCPYCADQRFYILRWFIPYQILNPLNRCSSNGADFAPRPQPQDTGQRVETFLVARTPGKNATGIWWGQGGCETSHSTLHRAPSTKNYLDQMSVSPRWRTPNLNHTKTSIILPKVYILCTFIFQTIFILFKVVHAHRGGKTLLLFHSKLSSTIYPQFYFTKQPLSNLTTVSVIGSAP